MSKFSKEIQIGLVAVVGIVVLYFGLQFLKGLNFFSTDNRYYVKFDNISGLSVSCPIFANGYRVGVVKNIIYDYERQGNIVAVVEIDKQLKLPKSSTAEITSDLLGNIKLELKFGSDFNNTVAVGDTIDGNVDQGLMGKASTLVPIVEKALPKLDSILSSVNILLADPALASSLHNIDAISTELNQTSRELHLLTQSLNRQVPVIMTNANNVLMNVDTLTATLNTLDVAATLAKVDQTLNNVQELTAKLNSREGTVGKFLNDPGIYNNLNSTVMHLDSLMIDLKAHPSRYVHVSLFGKKNK